MTKYTLETTDETVAKRAMSADGLCQTIWALDEEMRNDEKYQDGDMPTHHWRDRLTYLLEAHGVNMEEIWV